MGSGRGVSFLWICGHFRLPRTSVDCPTTTHLCLTLTGFGGIQRNKINKMLMGDIMVGVQEGLEEESRD